MTMRKLIEGSPLTVEDIALELGVSISTIYRYQDKADITPPIKLAATVYGIYGVVVEPYTEGELVTESAKTVMEGLSNG